VIAAVVPTFNRRELLERAVRSIEADEIVVVDDGSTEDVRVAGTRQVRIDGNRGFAHAVNRGIEAAAGDWVAIVNNDAVLEPGYLTTLRVRAELAGAWFATGKILRENDPSRIDATFDLVTRSGLAWRAGEGWPADRLNEERPIAIAPMTAALFRRELFEKVGLLDESFGSYLEDVDFGIRCAAAGYRGVYVPSARALHRGSATLGAWRADTVRLLSRNQMFLVKKHLGPDWIWHSGRSVIWGQALWGWAALRRGRFGAWWQGKREARSLTPETVAGGRRAIEESERELLEMARGDRFWDFYRWLT
jgi:hypothetical protein